MRSSFGDQVCGEPELHMCLPRKIPESTHLPVLDGAIQGVDDVKHGSVPHRIQSSRSTNSNQNLALLCPFILLVCHRGLKIRDLKQTENHLTYALARQCPYSCYNYERNRANGS